VSQDWVELTGEHLSVAAATEFVTTSSAGGIAVFLGTTRSEDSTAGTPLAALDYEAYREMAIGQMKKLAVDARGRWPIRKLALLHRTGRVALGEASVIIAVSTPHRGDAFEACRWLIDTLKASVTIWKKEVWADGSTSWVEGTLVEGERRGR
jgi:molybdopterin synthase catalytic subunit